jgi:hypothetical protein
MPRGPKGEKRPADVIGHRRHGRSRCDGGNREQCEACDISEPACVEARYLISPSPCHDIAPNNY